MSVSSIIASSAHAAFSRGGLGSTASGELNTLFAKLHLDALSSQATSTPATTPTPPSTGSDAVTSVVSGLRGLLDGGVSLASTARSAAKVAATYASGGGAVKLGSALIDKLA